MASRLLWKGFVALGTSAAVASGMYSYRAKLQEQPPTTDFEEDNPSFSTWPWFSYAQMPENPGWDYDWDKRDPNSLIKPPKPGAGGDAEKLSAKLDKVTSKARRHIFLVRHGQYVMEDEDELCHLTPLGKVQAEITGQRLKALNFDYTSITTSTMTRALETTEEIAKFLPNVKIKKTDLIREGAPIPPDPPISHWKPEYKQYFIDGARIEAAFKGIFHRAPPAQVNDSYEVIVCHANVIRYFICRALQFPPNGWLRISLHNSSITWITIAPNGRVILRMLGDCGHMPLDKLTTS